MDTGGGSRISRAASARRRSSRLNQRASAISSSSTRRSGLPRPLRRAGSPVSGSAASARAGCPHNGPGRRRSRFPPAPRGPRPAQPIPRARRNRQDGHPALRPAPVPGQQAPVVRVRDQHDDGGIDPREMLAAVSRAALGMPAATVTVGVPQRGQCVWVACQLASATACVNRPASRSFSSAAASRRLAGRSPGRARARQARPAPVTVCSRRCSATSAPATSARRLQPGGYTRASGSGRCVPAASLPGDFRSRDFRLSETSCSARVLLSGFLLSVSGSRAGRFLLSALRLRALPAPARPPRRLPARALPGARLSFSPPSCSVPPRSGASTSLIRDSRQPAVPSRPNNRHPRVVLPEQEPQSLGSPGQGSPG